MPIRLSMAEHPWALLGKPFRRAEKTDAALLAELGNHAGDGLPVYLWGKLAEPGESGWGVGMRRAARDDGSFSYRNAAIIEHHGQAAGCLIGSPINQSPYLMICRRCSCHFRNWRTLNRRLGDAHDETRERSADRGAAARQRGDRPWFGWNPRKVREQRVFRLVHRLNHLLRPGRHIEVCGMPGQHFGENQDPGAGSQNVNRLGFQPNTAC
jgi:hypothetical protein